MSEQAREVVCFRGKRVFLRPVMENDIPYLLRWINDEEVSKYLGTYLPMMEADEKRWFENLSKEKQTNLVFTIVTSEGKPIGVMTLREIKWKDGVATTGALIGEKEYWGKGYGTEAKMLLLNYAFNTLNLRKICSAVFAYNKRSYKYQMKCGYREEGRRRRQFYKNGRYCDEILMVVFKKDWLPLWRKYQKTHLQ